MAIQIIPEQGVGESLGAGLGAGLQGLAQLKTQDLMRRQQAQYNVPMLQGLFPGVSNQQLQQLSMSDPSLINQLLKRQYEMKQSAQLADIYQDTRLANLLPSQISSYMSSPEYTKSRAMKEASGPLGNIKKLIESEGGVSGGPIGAWVSDFIDGKKSSYDALVSQLATSKDPLISSLAAGLNAAKDDKTRKTIFNTFVKNNPDSMPQVGQATANILNQYADSEGSQQQAMGNDQQQQGDGLIQEAPERTLGQQATGIGAELVKSPVNLADAHTALTDKAGKLLGIDKVEKSLGIDKNESSFVNVAKNFGKDDQNNKVMNDVYKEIQNKLGISSDGKEDFKGVVNNIAEKISPGSTSKENLGLLESAAQTTASAAPLIAMFAPFTAAGLATAALVDFTGNVAGETLKEIGVGGVGQFAGNVLTSMLARKGFGSLANYYNKVKSPGSTVEQLNTQLYKDARAAGSKPTIETGSNPFSTSPAPADSIQGKLDAFMIKVKAQDIGKGFSKVEQDALFDNAKATKEFLAKKLVSPNDLADKLKNINNNWIDNKTLNSQFYKQYRGIIADAVSAEGAINKEWYNLYKPAQELYSIQNWRSGLTKGIEKYLGVTKFENLKSSPYMALTLPFISKTRAVALGAATLVPGFIDKAGRAVKIFDFIQKSPQGRELLTRLITAGAKNNADLASKALINLNKFYNKHDKKLKEAVDKKINL